MKREDVKTIFPDATKEQIDSFMALYGAGIEREKEKLKESNAGAEDYKAKFEQLQAKIAEDEQKAKAAAAEKEKADKIAGRFAAVVGDRKFSHDAIRADYLNRFAAALADDANAGKSDADILHALTKDDAAAFVNVTTTHLEGGKPMSSDKLSKEDILKIKDGAERRAAMAEAMKADPDFFK